MWPASSIKCSQTNQSYMLIATIFRWSVRRVLIASPPFPVAAVKHTKVIFCYEYLMSGQSWSCKVPVPRARSADKREQARASTSKHEQARGGRGGGSEMSSAE